MYNTEVPNFEGHDCFFMYNANRKLCCYCFTCKDNWRDCDEDRWTIQKHIDEGIPRMATSVAQGPPPLE
jgi:hypothetical protein